MKVEYLNLKEASEYSHIGIWALRGAISDGDLPSYKPRKYRLVKKHELDDYINRGLTKIPGIKKPEPTGARR